MYKYYNALIMLFVVCQASASETLDFSFLQGTQTIPTIFNESLMPSGEYIVDVFLNNKKVSRGNLLISFDEEKSNILCINKHWMNRHLSSVDVNNFSDFHNKAENCYYISKEASTTVDFDYNNQKLAFSIPQAYIKKGHKKSAGWDYGSDGIKMDYNANVATNINDYSLYISSGFDVNYNKWILSGSLYGTKYKGISTNIKFSDFKAVRVIAPLKGNFILGKSYVDGGSLFDGFDFYGASLISDRAMYPYALKNYAPVISGVANSTSRITVKQRGYILYSTIIPAGPYYLNDLVVRGGGEINVSIEEETGEIINKSYYVSSLSSLLRENDFNYSFSIGDYKVGQTLNDYSDGIFVHGKLDYGFDFLTINNGFIFNENYRSIGSEAVKSLGYYGGLSLGIVYINAKKEENEIDAYKLIFKYQKEINENTYFHILSDIYPKSNYIEFKDFSKFEVDNHIPYVRSRYEANIMHNFTPNVSLSTSLWSTLYEKPFKNEEGISLSFSAPIPIYNKNSLIISSSYQKNRLGLADYFISVNVNIPLSYKMLGNLNFGTYKDRSGEIFFTQGVNQTLSEKISYSVNATSSKYTSNLSANIDFNNDISKLNMSFSKGENSNSTLSGNVSGRMIASPDFGVIFNKEQAGTLAVVRAKELKGITFNSSAATNDKGYTVVPLNEYGLNKININTENIPNNVELLDTSYNVTPTHNALIYRDYAVDVRHLLLLSVKDVNGERVQLGSSAYDENDINIGFVDVSGLLVLALKVKPKFIIIKNGIENCYINVTEKIYENRKVQNVSCKERYIH